MGIEIRELRKQDHSSAISFAIQGMHFDWYLDSPLLLKAYGRYFWYLELNRATHILAAYADGRFAGVLLAEIYGEPAKHRVLHERLYVKAVDLIQQLFFRGGAGLYENTTADLTRRYLAANQPDGELIFLAADPGSPVRGIGTALLRALEEQIPGKTIYLHTDDACTYRFYERRGFHRAQQADIRLEMPKGVVPLKCLLYCKTIPDAP